MQYPESGKAAEGPMDDREEVAAEATPDEDLEGEARTERPEGKREGLAEEVKEKGEELLDKVSGPDIPPSLSDEEKRD